MRPSAEDIGIGWVKAKVPLANTRLAVTELGILAEDFWKSGFVTQQYGGVARSNGKSPTGTKAIAAGEKTGACSRATRISIGITKKDAIRGQ